MPPNGLDPKLVTLAKAIRQQESGGDPTRKGASGEYGAYQFLPATWNSYAKNAGVSVPLEQATLEQQNEVAYKNLERMSKAHPDWNVGNFASAWNAGEGKPNAYKEGNVGTNSQGVKYDTPAYAKAVATYYQQFKQEQAQPQQAPEAPPEPESQYGATFPASPNDSGTTAGLKALGNVPSSAVNFGIGAIKALNPLNTIENLSQIPGELGALAKEKGGILPALGAAAKEFPNEAYKALVPQGIRQIFSGDVEGAARTFTEDPIGQVAPAVLGARYGAQKLGAGEAFDAGISKVGGAVARPIAATAKGIGTGISDVTKFGIGQATGLKPTTISTITQNPSSFSKEAQGTIDRKSVADEVKAALDKRDEELSETGKEYGPIRSSMVEDTSVTPSATKRLKFQNSSAEYNLVNIPNEFLSLPELRGKAIMLDAGLRKVSAKERPALDEEIAKKAETDKVKATVKVDPNWLERAIRETTGLGVRDGRIVAKPTASIREGRDVSSLQKVYDLWRPTFAKGKLTNEEFLNFRQDIARIAKMDRDLGKSGPLENLSGIMRGKFNTAYRGQIKGLETLDEDFSQKRSDLDRLKKGILDRDGNLTTAGINRVANAVGKGKDLELAKLEEIVPGITKKIQILKAIEDIEEARGQKVGAYARGGLAAFGIGTGNIPAIIGAILSSPEMAVPILRRYGMAKPLVDSVLKALKKGAAAVNNSAVSRYSAE